MKTLLFRLYLLLSLTIGAAVALLWPSRVHHIDEVSICFFVLAALFLFAGLLVLTPLYRRKNRARWESRHRVYDKDLGFVLDEEMPPSCRQEEPTPFDREISRLFLGLIPPSLASALFLVGGWRVLAAVLLLLFPGFGLFRIFMRDLKRESKAERALARQQLEEQKKREELGRFR